MESGYSKPLTNVLEAAENADPADDCLSDLLQRAEADEVSRRYRQPCRFTMKSSHTPSPSKFPNRDSLQTLVFGDQALLATPNPD